MNISKPVFRGLLILEFIAAYAVPCIFLGLGTLIVIPGLFFVITNWVFEILWLVLLVAGGYIGMIGVLEQAIAILGGDEHKLKRRSFIYTFIGCVTVLPFTWFAVETGEALSVFIGLAPILVAVQLTFMNRQQLLVLIAGYRSRNKLPVIQEKH